MLLRHELEALKNMIANIDKRCEGFCAVLPLLTEASQEAARELIARSCETKVWLKRALESNSVLFQLTPVKES